MAVFTSSVFTLRRKMIIQALREAGAVTPETAKALSETNLVNPDSWPEYTRKLTEMKIIHGTPDGKYYVDRAE